MKVKNAKTPTENVLVFPGCRISILKEGLIRVEYGDSFVDEASQKIWHRDFGVLPFRKTEGKQIELTVGPYEYHIDREDFGRGYVLYQGKKIHFSNQENLKGASRTLDMSPEGKVHYDDPITGERREIAYRDPSILADGVVARNGLAVFDDAVSLLFAEDGFLKPNRLEHDYYVFFYPRDPEGAVKALYELTETPPMLPRFVFGNWWSRYHAYTDKEYLSLMEKFEEKQVPLSVATIDMDWHYVDIAREFDFDAPRYSDPKYGSHSGWTGWSWNRHLFPDHKTFLKALKSRGLKITLNLHPSEGIRFFEDAYPKFAQGMGIDPKSQVAIPFDFSNPLFVDNYFSMLHDMEEEGVDFWWVDWQQGSKSKIAGYDPLWGLNHFHYLDSLKTGKRGLLLSRYSELGSHRYPLGFSGDTIQTWDVLDYVISFTARSANSGYTFWSHDIGAHHAGNRDGELYLRWLQFGIYSPVLRLHSCNSPFAGKEPWNYPKEIEVLAEETLRERHRLIPYLYTQAYLNHEEGQCFIRPLYYRNPDDPEAYRHDTEYYLGDLLVAPISFPRDKETGRASKQIYLPKGNWVDLSSNVFYRGEKTYRIDYDLGDTPVFIKEGTIVYRAKSHQDSGEIEFTLLKGNGSSLLYEDDGESLDGTSCKTVVEQAFSENEHTIILKTKGDVSLLPKNRSYIFKLLHERPDDVKANRSFARYDYETYTLLCFSDVAPGEELTIHIVEEPCPLEQLRRTLHDVLVRESFANAEGYRFAEEMDKAKTVKELSRLAEKWDLNPVAKVKVKQIIAYYCSK